MNDKFYLNLVTMLTFTEIYIRIFIESKDHDEMIRREEKLLKEMKQVFYGSKKQ